MAAIFDTRKTGTASRIKLDDDVKFAFINFVTFNDKFNNPVSPIAIIQQTNVTQATNHQFNLSLRQTIYLYVFGNQMGEARISGFIFSGTCEDTNANGIESINAFYTENRLSSRTEEVEIVVGQTSFKGYLTSLIIHDTNTETLVTPFTMTVKLLPDTDKTKATEVATTSTGTPPATVRGRQGTAQRLT